MLTYRRGLDCFHGFSVGSGAVLFSYFVGDFFLVPCFSGWNYPALGGAGELFSRFPRLGMPSGVTLVN